MFRQSRSDLPSADLELSDVVRHNDAVQDPLLYAASDPHGGYTSIGTYTPPDSTRTQRSTVTMSCLSRSRHRTASWRFRRRTDHRARRDRDRGRSLSKSSWREGDRQPGSPIGERSSGSSPRHLINLTRCRGLANVVVLAAPASLLANVARRTLVNDGALIKCLDSGHLSGVVSGAFRAELLPDDHPSGRIRQSASRRTALTVVAVDSRDGPISPRKISTVMSTAARL